MARPRKNTLNAWAGIRVQLCTGFNCAAVEIIQLRKEEICSKRRLVSAACAPTAVRWSNCLPPQSSWSFEMWDTAGLSPVGNTTIPLVAVLFHAPANPRRHPARVHDFFELTGIIGSVSLVVALMLSILILRVYARIA